MISLGHFSTNRELAAVLNRRGATVHGTRVPVTRWVLLFYVLAAVMISGDIVFVFSVPMTVRWAQLCLLFPISLALAKSRAALKVRWPLGFHWLLLWTLFMFAFVPNSSFPLFSAEYAGWLLFNVALVFATVQLFHLAELTALMRWYVLSFLGPALFGLLQFMAPVFGIPVPLTRQWWIPGVFARINGFSYEPSYFAMYLATGWVMSAYLLRHPVRWISRRLLKFCFLVEGAALMLSGARTAWLLFGVWFLQFPLRLAAKLLTGRVHVRSLRITLGGLTIAVLGALLVVRLIGVDNIAIVFRGTGLLGQDASWSFAQRANMLMDTFQAFWNSPLIGRSLGGVNVAVAELHGYKPETFEEASKLFTGLGAFLEVLAASGAVGVIPFLIYWSLLMWKPWVARTILPPNERSTMLALVVSLAMATVILQVNQNVLRPYLWFHVAILSAYYDAAVRSVRSLRLYPKCGSR